MTPVEAIKRFARWTDRSALRRDISDDWHDRWPEGATAACVIVGALDGARDDNDLRAGLAQFDAAYWCSPATFKRAIEDVIKLHSDAAGRPYRIKIRVQPDHALRPLAESPQWTEYELRVIRITPAMAVRLLWPDAYIARLADKMRRGQWRPVDEGIHDGIRFYARSGYDRREQGRMELHGGNHRMRAIVMAGVPIETEVRASPEAFDWIEEIRADLERNGGQP